MCNLTATNPANSRQVESIFGKAVCAYANWMTAEEQGMKEISIACESEYEASVRILEMFVEEHLPTICMKAIEEAEKMMQK